MALRQYSFDALPTTLAAGCTAIATTIQVVSKAGFPSSFPYALTLEPGTANSEVVEVTGASGTTLTVIRGVDGTTGKIHSSGARVVHVDVSPRSRKWDCAINGMPFLFAVSEKEPYLRETAEFRRQRIDNERNPGEQSLDSGYWLRSQASWHLGSGLPSAEPLESSELEAQFRFQNSRGVDPWTPGELSLLPSLPVWKSGRGATASYHGVITFATGVFSWHNTSLYFDTATSSFTPTFAGTTQVMAATTLKNQVAYVTEKEVVVGSPSFNNFAVQYNGGTYITMVAGVKGRLLVGDMNKLYEITNLAPGSPPVAFPAAIYTHTDSQFRFVAAADAPAAVYLAGGTTLASSIYSLTATDAGGVVTLGALVERAQLPAGETVLWMASYLGTYLVLGTTAGYRVAAINDDGSLTLGPVLIDIAGMDEYPSKYGIAFRGRYCWVVSGGGQPSLFRIDLGSPLDGDLRFPVAADMDCKDNAGTYHVVTGVALDASADVLIVQVKGEGLYKESLSARVPSGWLTTGRIRMGTLEAKAWLEGRLVMKPGTTGTAQLRASTTGSGSPTTWTSVTSASGTNWMSSGSMSAVTSTPSSDLYVAVQLSSGTATTTGYQIQALPAPNRSRLIQVPVLLFDYEVDRSGVRHGSRSAGYERLKALEELEQSAGTVRWTDFTTGETAEAYIEKVSFSRVSPPSRGHDNSGGVCRVLLRFV